MTPIKAICSFQTQMIRHCKNVRNKSHDKYDPKSPCGNGWKAHMQLNPNVRCGNIICKNKAKHGAHVFIKIDSGTYSTEIELIPLCAKCNNSHNTHEMELRPRVKPIPIPKCSTQTCVMGLPIKSIPCLRINPRRAK